jgi:hypothetical protein
VSADFDEALETFERAGADDNAVAGFELGIGFEGGPIFEGEMDVAEFVVEGGLVGDADDGGDAVGAVGLVGIVDGAAEEEVAGEEGFGDGGLASAIEANVAGEGEEVEDGKGGKIGGEGFFLAAPGVEDEPLGIVGRDGKDCLG